jgi:hypothetical protein
LKMSVTLRRPREARASKGDGLRASAASFEGRVAAASG